MCLSYLLRETVRGVWAEGLGGVIFSGEFNTLEDMTVSVGDNSLTVETSPFQELRCAVSILNRPAIIACRSIRLHVQRIWIFESPGTNT